MVRRLAKAESERIWKEAVVAKSRYYPGIFLKVLRKTTNTSGRIAYVPTQDFTQTLLDCKYDAIPLS
jgi:hypothetical protein